MDGLTLLAEARRAGLAIWAEGGKLHIRGPREEEALARQLLARKAELLPLLAGVPVCDRQEAERLLEHLRRELARVERDEYLGRFPELVARLTADGIALCEGHVRNHAQLAARGWDPLEYLRGQVALTLALARGEPQGRPQRARQDIQEAHKSGRSHPDDFRANGGAGEGLRQGVATGRRRPYGLDSSP
jgi:hypothetical protein